MIIKLSYSQYIGIVHFENYVYLKKIPETKKHICLL